MPYADPSTGQTIYSQEELNASWRAAGGSNMYPGGTEYENFKAIEAAYQGQSESQITYANEQARLAAMTPEQIQSETIKAEIDQLRSAPNLHSDEGRWAHYVELVNQYDTMTPGDQQYLITQAIGQSDISSADIAREQYGSALTSQKAASGDTTAQAAISSGAWQPGTEAAERAAAEIGVVAVQQTPVVLQGPAVVNTNPEVPIGTVSQATGNVWTGTGWGSQEQFYGSIISNANRPGYTPIQTLGDITTQDLIFGFGYSPLQATIIQASIASNQFDATATRFYGNEAQKSFQDIVEISSGYHAWAKQTGLPQAPNPYEYAGDLALAVLKGTSEQSKSSAYGVAPVDYSGLNLPNEEGLQDVAWNAAIGYDRTGNYSVDYSKFLIASDVVTEAIVSGNMGPYAALGKPYSSEYGTLTLGQQQLIATDVAKSQGYAVHPEVPIPDYSFDWSVMGGTALYTGALAEAHATETGATLQEPFTSMNVPTVVTKPSEEWVQGIPVIGGMLAYAGISPKLSELQGIPYIYEAAAWISPKEIETTTRGTPYNANISDIYRRSAGADYTMQYLTSEGGLSDIYGTITPTTTSITTRKSAFDEWQADIAQQTGLSKIPVPTSEQISGAGILMQMYNPAFGIYSQTPIGQHTISSNIEEITQRPVSFAGEVGAAALLGGAFRAGEEAYAVGRAATAEMVISEGGLWRFASSASGSVVEYAPKALTALYGVDVAGRATLWGSDFSQVQERTGDILGRETIPMGIGFAAGYGALDTARLSDIGYKSSLQEGMVNSRFEYYVKGPVTKPIDIARLNYESFRQESAPEQVGVADYLQFRTERATALADIRVKSIIQESGEVLQNVPYRLQQYGTDVSTVLSGEPGITVESMARVGFNKGSPLSSEKTFSPGSSSLGTRIVGGKTVSGLRNEPSLKSLGVEGEATQSLGTRSIGTSVDYRNMPKTSEKPYTKLAGQEQIVLTEELPAVEGMTKGNIQPSGKVLGSVSVLLPEMQLEDVSAGIASMINSESAVESIASRSQGLVFATLQSSPSMLSAQTKSNSILDDINTVTSDVMTKQGLEEVVVSESASDVLTSFEQVSIVTPRSTIDFGQQVVNQLYWYNLPKSIIPNPNMPDFPHFPVGGIGYGGSTPARMGPGWPRPRKRNYENPVVDIDYLSRMNAPFANTQRRSPRKSKKSKR